MLELAHVAWPRVGHQCLHAVTLEAADLDLPGPSRQCPGHRLPAGATAVLARDDLPVDELIAALLERHRVYISGGIDELADKIFRIGHMGRSTERRETDRLLAAFDEVVRGAGLQQGRASNYGVTMS